MEAGVVIIGELVVLSDIGGLEKWSNCAWDRWCGLGLLRHADADAPPAYRDHAVPQCHGGPGRCEPPSVACHGG